MLWDGLMVCCTTRLGPGCATIWSAGYGYTSHGTIIRPGMRAECYIHCYLHSQGSTTNSTSGSLMLNSIPDCDRLGYQKIESKDLWLTSRERRKKGNNNNKSINIISLIDQNCRMKKARLCLVGCWRPVCGWLSERGGCSCKRPHKPPTLPPQPLARIRQ